MDSRQKEIDSLKDYKYGFSTDIENIKAPIFWVEEISTGSYVQVALNVKNGNTNLLIKSKFRNPVSVVEHI